MTDTAFIKAVVLRRDAIKKPNEYPFSLPAVTHLDRLDLHPRVTFFVGENGMGKSTLLEAIAVAWGFNAEGGSMNFAFSTRASEYPLADHLALSRGQTRPLDGYFLRAESFYNVATEIENLNRERQFGPVVLPDLLKSYGGRSLHEQSHGEAFFTLFMKRFREGGLYLLDEPEAALSPMRQLAMLARLHQLARSGAQLIIATHSPLLIAYPDADILHFGDDGIKKIAYDETEHVTVTRQFLDAPERMLRILLGEGESSPD